MHGGSARSARRQRHFRQGGPYAARSRLLRPQPSGPARDRVGAACGPPARRRRAGRDGWFGFFWVRFLDTNGGFDSARADYSLRFAFFSFGCRVASGRLWARALSARRAVFAVVPALARGIRGRGCIPNIHRTVGGVKGSRDRGIEGSRNRGIGGSREQGSERVSVETRRGRDGGTEARRDGGNAEKPKRRNEEGNKGLRERGIKGSRNDTPKRGGPEMSKRRNVRGRDGGKRRSVETGRRLLREYC